MKPERSFAEFVGDVGSGKEQSLVFSHAPQEQVRDSAGPWAKKVRVRSTEHPGR